MTIYKINGNNTPMPDNWADVSYGDAMNIIENNLSEVAIFGLFAKMSKKEVRNLNGDDVKYFLDGFPFLRSTPMDDTPDIPMSIMWKGVRRFFPHADLKDELDFGETSVGQIEDMKQVITSASKLLIVEEGDVMANIDLIKMMPSIVAIYIQPFINGEYDYKKAMNIAKEIETELSFKETVLMGNFFLYKLTTSTSGLMKGLHILKWIKKRWTQGLRILTRRSGFMSL